MGTNSATLFVQQTLRTSLVAFKLQVGRWPTTAEGLEVLFKCPPGEEERWRGPYLDGGKLPLDPWGNPYHYRYPATRSSRHYDVWSLGPDRLPSADDIGNWESGK